MLNLPTHTFQVEWALADGVNHRIEREAHCFWQWEGPESEGLLMGSVLLLDVLLQHFYRRTATATGKITWTP